MAEANSNTLKNNSPLLEQAAKLLYDTVAIDAPLWQELDPLEQEHYRNCVRLVLKAATR